MAYINTTAFIWSISFICLDLYQKTGCIMRPKDTHENPDLFLIPLEKFIDMSHELVILANEMDWSIFERKFDAYYVGRKGRPGAPIRLMAGLHYLKYAFDETDESVLYWFLENPYWQYFCGYDYFQKSVPVDPSSLTRFRKRIGPEGLQYLVDELDKTVSQLENQNNLNPTPEN